MPLFLHDDGRALMPTARSIWDQILAGDFETDGHIMGDIASRAYAESWKGAERQGQIVFDEIVRSHREWIENEREKGEYAFAARRRAVMRVGLPAVRAHRESQLLEEESTWREQLDKKRNFSPEMVGLLLARIEGSDR
jgi:hypothetical protein